MNVKTVRFLCWIVTVGLGKGDAVSTVECKIFVGKLISASTEMQLNRFSVKSLEQACVSLDKKVFPLDKDVPGVVLCLGKAAGELHCWWKSFMAEL